LSYLIFKFFNIKEETAQLLPGQTIQNSKENMKIFINFGKKLIFFLYISEINNQKVKNKIS